MQSIDRFYYPEQYITVSLCIMPVTGSQTLPLAGPNRNMADLKDIIGLQLPWQTFAPRDRNEGVDG